MRCLIVYFSLDHASEAVAQQIAKTFEDHHWQVDAHNLTNLPNLDLDVYDMFGFGSPVYYFSLPVHFQHYLEALPSLNNKPTFIFLLSGTYAYDTSLRFTRLLKQKQADIIGYYYAHGEDYYYPYLKLGALFSVNHPTTNELTDTQKFALDMIEHPHDNPWIEHSTSPTMMVRFQRLFTKRFMIEKAYQSMFKLDKQRCQKCGACVRDCPTHNLTKDKDNYPVWNKSCILCLHCEMNCPHEAIISPMSSPTSESLIKRNVIIARQDPSIDHVDVSVKNGSITRQA